MVADMRYLTANKDENSMEVTLFDWHVLDQLYVFILSEWAQNEEKKCSYPLLSVDDTPLAFTFEYISFFGHNGTCIE